jgi:hypothetical protein
VCVCVCVHSGVVTHSYSPRTWETEVGG